MGAFDAVRAGLTGNSSSVVRPTATPLNKKGYDSRPVDKQPQRLNQEAQEERDKAKAQGLPDPFGYGR